MAIRSVVDFLEATGSDHALTEDLVATLGVGDGDISGPGKLDAQEAEALIGLKAVEVCALAEGRGFRFTVRELHTVVEAVQALGVGEVSEESLRATLGLSTAPSTGAREAISLAYRGIRYARLRAVDSDRLDVVRFFERTASDDALRAELRALLETGDGDISDFSALDEAELRALKTARGTVVADFAARLGYNFRLSELYALLDAYQRMQNGELSQTAFEGYVTDSAEGARVLPAIRSVAELTYKGVGYERVLPSVVPDDSLGVVRFLHKSHFDETLRERLQGLIGGDGDVSAPQELDAAEFANLGARSAEVVALAAQDGFRFSIEDLNAVVGAFQLVSEGALSQESCNRILGITGSAGDDTVQAASTAARRMYRGVPMP